jgi:hypothetical protein
MYININENVIDIFKIKSITTIEHTSSYDKLYFNIVCGNNENIIFEEKTMCLGLYDIYGGNNDFVNDVIFRSQDVSEIKNHKNYISALEKIRIRRRKLENFINNERNKISKITI